MSIDRPVRTLLRSKAHAIANCNCKGCNPELGRPAPTRTPCATTSAKSVPGAQLTLPLLSLCVEAACVRIGYWRPAAAAQPSCSPLRQRDLWGARGPLRGGDRHLPCRCSLPGTLVCPVHACTRVGAATNGDGAPPGMRNPTHTQERSMGSEEVHRQGIELLCCESMVAAARRLLRRDGPRSASDDGRDAGGSWYLRGREHERLLGRTATRVTERPTSPKVCSERSRSGDNFCGEGRTRRRRL